jgi:ubiquinone/menaquinone biosynthesis C-methylase UbiE
MRTAIVLLALGAAARAKGPLDGLDGQARAMLDPLREQALRPAELIARMQVRPDSVVADIGAGPGWLTLPLARAAWRGWVIATDIRADYLAVLARRAAEAGIKNIATRIVGQERNGLDDRSVDLIVLCQVDHYLRDRPTYFASLVKALRPSGRIVLVNYVRHREVDLAAARLAQLRVVSEWTPSPPFFMMILVP